MSRVEGRVGPLEREGPRARAPGHGPLCGGDTLAKVPDECACCICGPGRLAHADHAVEDVVERRRIEREDLGGAAECGEGTVDEPRRYGAHRAEVLREDEVRAELAHCRLV